MRCGDAKEFVISEPIIISRDAHNVSRQHISQGALDVLYDLGRAGYEAYLVGGGVRDLLAGLQPKDFDVATDAKPEEVKDVFRRARLIGRRFRLAHVRAGGEIIEVATFRAQPRTPEEGEEQAEEALDDDDHMLDEGGRILRDNVYGTLEDDAFRRDFTINALYYRVTDFSVVDYVGGMEDMAARQIRLIGDPETRYREDPVRMLRAVRIANKLGFTIEAATAQPIRELAGLLTDVPGARLFDEVLKLFLSEQAEKNFDDLIELGLFQVLFPQTAACLHQDGVDTLIRGALRGTAERVREDKPVTPAFLYAALLWPVLRGVMEPVLADGQTLAQAIPELSGDVVAEQVETVAIPRRFSTPMREIWSLQPRFHRRNGRRPERLAAHPRFRAAYDFLILRAAAGEESEELVQWWTDYQDGRAPTPPPGGPNPRGRRRRRRRRPGGGAKTSE
ncbi:polynucleotide adenylyltransferase PcnB [uncultured Abyssibacter sp.]|uniref:polynucleotide adenylyltransferase PcnB n=1 Tax=uncultured Abyssibacter sp. TaxID=2320202 RepID=UPI0032B2589F